MPKSPVFIFYKFVFSNEEANGYMIRQKGFVFDELSLFIFPKTDTMFIILKDSFSTKIPYSKKQ